MTTTLKPLSKHGRITLLDAPANRPPADVMYNEVFFDRKCALDDPEHKKFYEWCIDPLTKGNYTTVCDGLTGMKGACQVETEFKRKASRIAYYSNGGGGDTVDDTPIRSQMVGDDNRVIAYYADMGQPTNGSLEAAANDSSTPLDPGFVAVSSTLAPTEPPKTGDIEFHYKWTCLYGTESKATVTQGFDTMKPDEFEKINKFCEQEVYGVPWSMPLWLQLLIIFAVIVAVAGASIIFWNRWLRKKIYGPGPGDPMSSFSSASSVSNLGSGAGTSSGFGSGRNRAPQQQQRMAGTNAGSKSQSKSNRPKSSLRAQVIKLNSVAQPLSLARQPTLHSRTNPYASASSLRHSTQRSKSNMPPQKSGRNPSLIS